MKGLVRLSELSSLLDGLVDDFSTLPAREVDPLLPVGHRPSDLMPQVKSIMVHLTALKHTVDRYRPGGWWNNRYLHVKAVNKTISDFLAAKGFRTLCPNPQGHSRRTLMPKLQFKPLAYLAGLGWRGKNNLLIHPRFGPRVVIGVVLTDAPVEPTRRPVLSDGCGDCDLCLNACPIGALNPRGFDRFRCYYRNRVLKKPCRFACMRVCPIGADYEC